MANTLEIIIRAVNQASGEFRRVVEDMGRVAQAQKEANKTFDEGVRQIRNAGLVMSGFAAAGALAIRSFTREAIEARQAEAQLEVAVRNAGQSYQEFKGRIDEATASLQRKTGVDDEAQRRSLGLLTIALGDVNSALAALPAAMDLAAATGSDLTSTAIQLGRVLAGQQETIRGVPISFEGASTAGERLERVLKAVGGTAERTASPFDKLGKSMDELKESIGEAMLPAVERFIGGLQGMIEWLTKLPQPVQQAIGTGGVALTGILGLGGAIALVTSQVPKMVAGIGALIGAFTALRTAAIAAWAAVIAPAAPVAVAIGLVGTTGIRRAPSEEEREIEAELIRQGTRPALARSMAAEEVKRLELARKVAEQIAGAIKETEAALGGLGGITGPPGGVSAATKEAVSGLGQLKASLERYTTELDLATSFTGDFTDALERMGLQGKKVFEDVVLGADELKAAILFNDMAADGMAVTWERAMEIVKRSTSDMVDSVKRDIRSLRPEMAIGGPLTPFPIGLPEFTEEMQRRQAEAAGVSLEEFRRRFGGLPPAGVTAPGLNVSVFLDGRQVGASIGANAEDSEQVRSS